MQPGWEGWVGQSAVQKAVRYQDAKNEQYKQYVIVTAHLNYVHKNKLELVNDKKKKR